MSGGVVDWVIDVVDRAGPAGVGALIALETVLPPIPSEVILPLAGSRAEQGAMNVVAAWAAATTGSLAGALFLYGIGAWFGYDRLDELAAKRWFVVLGRKDLERGRRAFERHGGAIVFVGRFIPLVRSVVSVPAGVARMPLVRFCLFTAVGSAIWNAGFITAGWMLGRDWERVERFVAPIGYAVVVLILLWVAVLTYRKVGRHRADRRQGVTS